MRLSLDRLRWRWDIDVGNERGKARKSFAFIFLFVFFGCHGALPSLVLVTTHGVKTWGGNARLPNSLRFKVRPAPGNPQQLVGVIFHVPCLPPPAFQPDLRAIERVWQTVHALLDAQPALRRIPA